MTATATPPTAAEKFEEERRHFERLADAQQREERFLKAFDREIVDAAMRAPSPEKVHFKNKQSNKGLYLGTYRDKRDKTWHLRADGVQPRGAMIVGPPGIGKSASYFIPTLLTFEESAFVYDPKGELFMTTAGYRKALGHKVLLFAPTQDPGRSCHINPFDSIKWGTRHEIADVQNIVKLILDPKDKAAEGAEAHWIVTGSILLECVILWLHYNDPKRCNLKGCYDYLTDPRWVNLDEDDGKKKQTTAVEEALKHMLRIPHAPSGRVEDALQFGWTDANGDPSPYHPYVVHSAVEVQGKAPNEKSGVVSTTTRFLHPFRDEILAELTSYSDVLFDDLMNNDVPVDLFFWIPTSDVQRLRVVVSLFMQLLVRAHTGDNALEYQDGRAYYRFKHRLLLAVDEYPQLGKQEQFILALAVIRSFGLWPMLGVQSPSQIFETLGQRQTLTAMMFYKVFLKPNDVEDAKWISENIGYTTKREVKVSYSGGRFGFMKSRSESVEYTRDSLMHYDTLMSMPQSAAVVIAGSVDPNQWDNPIWAGRLFWEDNPELRRRSGDASKGGKYPAPSKSDVVHHAPRTASRDLTEAYEDQRTYAGVRERAPVVADDRIVLEPAGPISGAPETAPAAESIAIDSDDPAAAILAAAMRATAGEDADDMERFLELGAEVAPSELLEGVHLEDEEDDGYGGLDDSETHEPAEEDLER